MAGQKRRPPLLVGMPGKVKVQVDVNALRLLRRQPEKVLRKLDGACHAEVRRTLDISAFLVPRGGAPSDPVNLADTAFILGPVLNMGPLSTTWLGGYEHPAAGAIHEGFHWGTQTRVAPHFLRTAFKGARGRVRKDVAKAVMAALATLFPNH